MRSATLPYIAGLFMYRLLATAQRWRLVNHGAVCHSLATAQNPRLDATRTGARALEQGRRVRSARQNRARGKTGVISGNEIGKDFGEVLLLTKEVLQYCRKGLECGLLFYCFKLYSQNYYTGMIKKSLQRDTSEPFYLRICAGVGLKSSRTVSLLL